MKMDFKRFTTVFIGLLFCMSMSTCSTYKVKLRPQYHGIDSRVVDIVKEYKELAKLQGITFHNDVSIGFTKLNMGDAVGLTTYGDIGGWREIDLDIDFYNNSDSVIRTILLFHELSHAFCDREHDFSDGKTYPDPKDLWFVRRSHKTLENGYYPDDGCPLSILYPIVLEEPCFLSHYNDYVKEMFNRCIVW
jgi:hypothetical protein